MKTKYILRFFLSFLLLMPVAIFAQDQDRKDKIETMHIAYLSEKLNLTSAEAEKFWPIYNQYKAGRDQLRKQRMDNVETVKKAGGVDNMSDAEVQKLLADETDLETRELELRKEYVAKFQQAIPTRKVAKFFIAEDEFKRYLLNQLRKRREQNGRGMNDDDMGPR
jgi:Spy/CpxP family protein refolding chaperone